MSHTLWLYLFDTISNILNAFFSYSNDFDIFRNIHNDIDVEISDITIFYCVALVMLYVPHLAVPLFWVVPPFF